MKTLTFEQMGNVAGGKCERQAAVAYGSAIATIAAAPSIFGLILGAMLTVSAAYDYYDCLGVFWDSSAVTSDNLLTK